MGTERYTVLRQEGRGYYEEKKSRFYGLAFAAESEEAVQTRLAEIRKEFWDARHHCYAYRLGCAPEVCRFSDDGEPGGTAGRPMLDVLLGRDVTNVCIIVTRYFGGTLLGTGGLVRAYQAAARDALDHAGLMTVENGEAWSLLVDYSLFGKVDREAAARGYAHEKPEYGSDVSLRFFLTAEQAAAFPAVMTELCQGELILEKLGPARFGLSEQELCILPLI